MFHSTSPRIPPRFRTPILPPQLFILSLFLHVYEILTTVVMCADLRDTPLRYPSLTSLLSTGTGSSSSGGEFDPPGNDSLHDLSIHSRDSGRSSGYFDGGPFMVSWLALQRSRFKVSLLVL